MQFYFFFSSLYTIYFLCLSYLLHQPELPVWCCIGVVRKNILVLLLILGKEAYSLSPLSMTFAVRFCHCSMSSWGCSFLFLVCWEFLSWVHVGFFLDAFFLLIGTHGLLSFLIWWILSVDFQCRTRLV